MSKYLEFKEIPFKGKTKRFEIVSKTSFNLCNICHGKDYYDHPTVIGNICPLCKGTGKGKPITLGRIQWYSKWRQYCFFPCEDTIFNRDCMNDIIFFINNLMKDRQIKMGTYKGYVSEEDYKRLKNV